MSIPELILSLALSSCGLGIVSSVIKSGPIHKYLYLLGPEYYNIRKIGFRALRRLIIHPEVDRSSRTRLIIGMVIECVALITFLFLAAIMIFFLILVA